MAFSDCNLYKTESRKHGNLLAKGYGNPFNGRNTFTLIFNDGLFSVLVQSSSIGGSTRKPQVSDSVSKYTPPGSFHCFCGLYILLGVSILVSTQMCVCLSFFPNL